MLIIQGQYVLSALACLFVLLERASGRSLLHASEGVYPKIIPYNNKNSKRFCTFGCSSGYHVDGGIGYAYWGRVDKEYPVITDMSREAATEFLKGKDGKMNQTMKADDPVIKACKPSTQSVLNSIVVRNACAEIGGEDDDDDVVNPFLLQFTIEVPCSKSTMKKLEKQGIKYPETADGFLIPLKAFTSPTQPPYTSKFRLVYVRANPDFSPGQSYSDGDGKDGFAALRGKEENLGWFCKCPYGSKGKTTRSCTFIKSLEGFKCGDASTPDSQLAYEDGQIKGKCGD